MLLWTSAPVVDELHITTHYNDHYTSVYQEGNRHGFSNGITPVTIVSAPPCGTCRRRIVTSVSVYNPDPDNPVTIFVAEEDPAVPLQTIIVQKIVEPLETRTLECICTCCTQQPFPPGEGIDVYNSWSLIQAGVWALNFDSCLSATWDFVNNWVNVTFDWTLVFDSWTNILSLCWIDVDLSSLAWWWSINVLQDAVLVHATTNINFQDCLVATRNAPNNRIDVAFDPSISYDCDTKLLTVCWVDVDLYCERYIYWYTNMWLAVPSIDVMNNGLVELTNTLSIELPVIPITAANIRTIWAIFYVHNNWPVVPTIVAAAWVTIDNNPWTLAVDECIGFMIRNIWASTLYYRIS